MPATNPLGEGATHRAERDRYEGSAAEDEQ
jgi:hypothetical protein